LRSGESHLKQALKPNRPKEHVNYRERCGRRGALRTHGLKHPISNRQEANIQMHVCMQAWTHTHAHACTHALTRMPAHEALMYRPTSTCFVLWPV